MYQANQRERDDNRNGEFDNQSPSTDESSRLRHYSAPSDARIDLHVAILVSPPDERPLSAA